MMNKEAKLDVMCSGKITRGEGGPQRVGEPLGVTDQEGTRRRAMETRFRPSQLPNSALSFPGPHSALQGKESQKME